MLKQVLDSAKREYDFILLDCMPSLGMLTINALAAEMCIRDRQCTVRRFFGDKEKRLCESD